MSRFLLLLFLLTLGLGCNDDSEVETASSGDQIDLPDEETTEEPKKPEEGLPFELNRDAKSLLGMWIGYVAREHQEIPVMIVQVYRQKPTEDNPDPPYNIQVGQLTEESGKVEFEEGEASATSIDLTFVHAEEPMRFQGSLQDGVVLGNVITDRGTSSSARLVRPNQQMVEPPAPALIEGVNDLSELMQSGPSWEKLQKFVADHPDSPLVMNAFFSLAPLTILDGRTEEDFQKLLAQVKENLAPWGERMVNYASMNCVLSVANFYQYPATIEAELKRLDEELAPPLWKEFLQSLLEMPKAQAELAAKISVFESIESDQIDEKLQELKEELHRNRFNTFLSVRLGDIFAAREMPDRAIDSYLQVVAVPGSEAVYLKNFVTYGVEIETIRERLESSWSAAGREEDLDAFLLEEYDRIVDSFSVELPQEALDSPGRNVLLELFTGTACPPCIASDMAFSALHRKLDTDRVVMLQYHVHSPAPDPLANEDCQARFFQTRSSSTPTAFLNGKATPGLGGFAPQIQTNLDLLTKEIADELSEERLIELELEAQTTKKGFSVTVTGSSDELSKHWRLFVLLVEEKIAYQGPNRIPAHEMVVRKTLTSRDGEEADKGVLKFSADVSLEAIRKELLAGLARVEKRFSFEFDKKPVALNKLHLVAFVRDARSGRIREARSIAVPSSAGDQVSVE